MEDADDDNRSSLGGVIVIVAGVGTGRCIDGGFDDGIIPLTGPIVISRNCQIPSASTYIRRFGEERTKKKGNL